MPWIDASDFIENITRAQERRSTRHFLNTEPVKDESSKDAKTMICRSCNQEKKFDGCHVICSSCRYRTKLANAPDKNCKKCGRKLTGSARARNYCARCQGNRPKIRERRYRDSIT